MIIAKAKTSWHSLCRRSIFTHSTRYRGALTLLLLCIMQVEIYCSTRTREIPDSEGGIFGSTEKFIETSLSS